MDEQGEKLFTMLSVAVALMDDLDKLTPALEKLGKRHLKYGVQQAYYATGKI